ncbi:MAG TPA: polysaccharide biosynthesis/export family protein [Bacteroidales bacterium]|nr:polysaccharide biosynthesis/export family protein [Bacteroidales bacterium]
MGRFLIFLSIITSLLGTSCKTLSPTVMFETDKNFEYKTFSSTPKITILQPYDQIQILMSTNNGNTLLESALGQDRNLITSTSQSGITYLIRQDSTVKIPTLGLVKLGGISKDSAEVYLEKELSKYYQDPYIKITITNRNVILFFEEGTQGTEVGIPEEGITLLEAIAQVGGLTPNSKAYKIKLIRGDNKNPEVYNFNISSLEEFKKANFILQANDIIYVDSRPRYVTKVISEIQPYLVLMSTSVLVYSIFTR